MEFILADEKGIEIGPLRERDYIDIDCGNDNTFEIQVTNDYYKKLGISDGWRLGVQGKEYGGVIRKIITNTETNLVSLIGPTWRGMLEKKIIEPPAGEDYRIVSGDANTIINDISCVEFDGIFICAGASGIILNNFQFDRYVSHLAGFEKMLLSKNARLNIAYDSGEANGASFVRLSAVPIEDYSDEIEYSQDGTLSFLSFTFENYSGGINHLICLGKGELKNRFVLHLYADADGNIGNEQHFFGADERVSVYDYSNANSEEELREKGTEKLKELLSYKSMDVDLFNETLAGLRGVNDDISIGDIVGGRDFDTGIYLSKQITRKIVQVKDGRESIEYSVGKPVLNRSTANAPVEQSDPLDKLIKVTDDGTGLSIGKDAELSNTLDVGLALRTRKAFYQKNNQGFYIENANGVERECFHINGANQLHIGYGGYANNDIDTHVDGRNVVLTPNGGRVYANGALEADWLSVNNYIQSSAMNVVNINDGTDIATAFKTWKFGVCYRQGAEITVSNAPNDYNSGQYIFYQRFATYIIAHVYVNHYYICDTTNDVLNEWRVLHDPDGDVVISQGTSGIWTYRKWNSGKAECWGNYEFTPTLSNNANGAFFTNAMPISLPFTFNTITTFLVNKMSGGYLSWASGETAPSSKSTVYFYFIQYANSNVVSSRVAMYVLGTWK